MDKTQLNRLSSSMRQPIGILLLTLGTLHAKAYAGEGEQSRPTYDGLVHAKEICMGMSMKVKQLMTLVTVSGHSQTGGRPVNFGDASENLDDVLENDMAASYALTAMGNGTHTLGQSLDAATAHYNDPSFHEYAAKVCVATANLDQAIIGARTAAALPTVGQIQPSEFDSFVNEIQLVKSETHCY